MAQIKELGIVEQQRIIRRTGQLIGAIHNYSHVRYWRKQSKIPMGQMDSYS